MKSKDTRLIDAEALKAQIEEFTFQMGTNEWLTVRAVLSKIDAAPTITVGPKEQKITPRLIGIKEFMTYSGLGRNKAMELGKEIGARVELGGRVLYDLKKADAYFDQLTNDKEARA